MAKKNYCLSLEENDYNAFAELVKDKLTSVSREVNVYIRNEIQKTKEGGQPK